MGYLKQLYIENFKSWRGKQVIGPFMKFTCIVGPNGSGKSNVMDALSFVMGERPSALRVKTTKDLVHGAHIGRPVASTAEVAMCYCDDDGEETIFSRSISGSSSEYRISGRHVTLAEYTERLEKIGIVTKARNCLIFQGAVESIALKSAKERTKMFEQISQSCELVEVYDKQKQALDKSREDTQFCFNKKRTATAEWKQVAKEKQEAQRFLDLMEELSESRLRLSLFQLYHNGQRIHAVSRTLGERQALAAAKKTSLESWEQAVKAQKKEHGRLTRELQHREKEICGQENVLCQRRAQYVKAKVNTSHHAKKAEDARGTLLRSRRALAKREEELAQGRREMAELETAWRSWEQQAEAEGISRGRDIQLEAEQLERYKELREHVRKQVAVISQQAEKLHWDVKADHEKITYDQRRKKEVQGSIRNYLSQLEDLQRQAEKLEESAATHKASLQDVEEQVARLGAELQQGRQRGEEVNQELSRVLDELGNARLDTQESRRQRQRQQVLEGLGRTFPDTVYGRLVDLCSPIHKKYQLAVVKVFGHYMKAIVVASEKVARDCIRYLKEKRAEPETFLPVDYLDISTLNERLRKLHGAKLLVDVVQCNSGPSAPHVRKAVQFVCGNAMVCESIAEARSIAFDGPTRIKTVALDGTMFSTSGVISGGSSDLRHKARCWDEKDMRELNKSKEQLMDELRGLMKLKQKEPVLKQMETQARGAQTILRLCLSELDNLRKKTIPRCQADISRLESQLANLESQIQLQQRNVEQKDAQMTAFKVEVDQVEDLVFADFCAEIGVDSIREYEQEHLKYQTTVDKKRLEWESQRTRLSAQLEYEQEQLEQHMKKLRKVEENIDREEKAMAVQKKEEEKLLTAVEESQARTLEMKEELLVKKGQVADAKADLDQKTKSLQECSRELVNLQRHVIQAEVALEQKRLAKHNLLLGCKVQGLPVTLLSGCLDDISEVQLDSESESITNTLDIYEREEQLVMDYSSLGDELKCLKTEEEVDAELERLKEAVSSVEEVLQRTSAINLKAPEKLVEVKDKLQEAVDAFDTVTQGVRKCSKEFEQVKAQRFRLFSQCFEHVAVVIDQIYKSLCRNPSAQAVLSANNPDEPYLNGINYHCVAPGKRFMAMDNLSGGEKAIAALALVFAIHSFRPAPFFVLDEVDAALDTTNISKVTSFLREKSASNMQIIVISLKEEFYSKADALVGVYPETDDCMFSHMLTIDLRPYPLNEEEDEELRE